MPPGRRFSYLRSHGSGHYGGARVASQQFTAVGNSVIAANTEASYTLNSFPYPSGLAANNFHSAVIGVSSSNVGSGEVEVWLADQNNVLLWQQFVQVAFFLGDAINYTIPIPLTFDNLNNNVKIVVVNTLSISIEIDIVLDQEPITPGVLIAGQTGALTVRTDFNEGIIPYCANLFVGAASQTRHRCYPLRPRALTTCSAGTRGWQSIKVSA